MTGRALPTLRTPRLTLRPLEPSDAMPIRDAIANWDVVRWLSVVPYPYGIHDAENFIAEMRATDQPVWTINDENGLCGAIGLENELGFWLARPAWRRGYGFEAAVAAVDWWFSDPARGDLTSGYFAGNTRSAAVLRAVGFRQTGQGRRKSVALAQKVDAIDLKMTRTDWKLRQAFTLKTDRLCIRPLAPRDIPALEAFGQDVITRHTCTITPGWSAQQIEPWLARRIWTGYDTGTFAVGHDGVLFGTVGVGGSPLSASWMFLPEHWGKGYATEALTAFLPAWFARTTRSHLIAEIFEDNPGSQAVARKLGFTEVSRGMGRSKGRLEPAPLITYRLDRPSEATT